MKNNNFLGNKHKLIIKNKLTVVDCNRVFHWGCFLDDTMMIVQQVQSFKLFVATTTLSTHFLMCSQTINSTKSFVAFVTANFS